MKDALDEHSLPARAAAAHLVYLGYRTTFLGANVPSADLRDLLESKPPSAMVLSVAMTTHLVGARAVIAAVHDVGVPVLVGGKGLGEHGRWSEAVGADAYVVSLRDVAGIVDDWVNDGSPLIKAVAEAYPGSHPAPGCPIGGPGRGRVRPQPEVHEAQRRSQDAARSQRRALLTGDDQIVVDMLEWQESSLRPTCSRSAASVTPNSRPESTQSLEMPDRRVALTYHRRRDTRGVGGQSCAEPRRRGLSSEGCSHL